MPPSGDITRQLQQLDPKDPRGYDGLMRLVYERLRELARRQLQGERAGHTMGATALVHESFLRLLDTEQIDWQNRAHFYAIAVKAMKRVLIDYARARNRHKRRGSAPHISFEEAAVFLPSEDEAARLLMLNDALERYGQLDPRGKEAFEYTYIMNLSHKETADLLGVAPKTIQRDLRSAEAWLKEHYVAPGG